MIYIALDHSKETIIILRGKYISKGDVDKDIERITFDENAKYCVYQHTRHAYNQKEDILKPTSRSC